MLTKDEFLDKLDTFEMEVGLLENTVIANLKQERVNLIAMHVHQYKNILRKMEHLEHRVNDLVNCLSFQRQQMIILNYNKRPPKIE